MKLSVLIISGITIKTIWSLVVARDNCDIYKILSYGFELIFCGLFFIVLEIASISRGK